MPAYIDTLKRTLAELVDQRTHIDADIEDLRRIIARHEGTRSDPVTEPRQREPQPLGERGEGRAAPPGEGRRQTLELFANGDVWTAPKLGEARGTSVNAARAMLKRLARETPPAIEALGDGRYRIASTDAEGSLPDTGSDNGNQREGVDDVVSRAPA